MTRVAILTICLAGALAGCGTSSSKGSISGSSATTTGSVKPVPAARPAPAKRPKPIVKVVHSQYGQILADNRGQAFYAFSKENAGRSQCYGACASRWPPVLAKGQLAAGPGAQTRLLGTTRRTDGRLQLTYAGHPLYYYDADRPGRVLCQGAEEFGGLWLVVRGSGQPVR